MNSTARADLARTLDLWREATLTKDVALAGELRADDYQFSMPNGTVLSKQQELAALLEPVNDVRAYTLQSVRGREATFRCEVAAGHAYTITVAFKMQGGRWRAVRSNVVPEKFVERRPKRSWFRRGRPPSPLYIPYKAGEDFALPRTEPRRADDELPIPPQELWLGYDYPIHGSQHVDAMLQLLEAGGFAFGEGERILDFGCGAGRMIRHLRRFAETGEVWGTDISAEHILWCKRNLSPPFRFATSTKVPHLPFEDRSFRLIYCGSVFTHIDDLADAWLLELRRLLVPGGFLYVTIHDNHTLGLIEEAPDTHWLRWIRSREVYRQYRDSFDVITVGRDQESQVFYDRDYFLRMASSAFEIVSVTPEAYFYQTAVLLRKVE